MSEEPQKKTAIYTPTSPYRILITRWCKQDQSTGEKGKRVWYDFCGNDRPRQYVWNH